MSDYYSEYAYKGLVVNVPSRSTDGKLYTVSYGHPVHHHNNGKFDWSCTCPHFTYRCMHAEIGDDNRYCEHIKSQTEVYHPIIFWKGNPVFIVPKDSLMNLFMKLEQTGPGDMSDEILRFLSSVAAHVPFEVTNGLYVRAYRPEQYQAKVDRGEL